MLKVKKTVALDPRVVEVLDSYADIIGSSRSSIINDILLEALPTFEKVILEFRLFLNKTKEDLTEEDLLKLKSNLLTHLQENIDGLGEK